MRTLTTTLLRMVNKGSNVKGGSEKVLTKESEDRTKKEKGAVAVFGFGYKVDISPGFKCFGQLR